MTSSTDRKHADLTRDDITEWCRKYVADLLEVRPETIDPDVAFDRLGLDSALAVSLLIEIEERYGVELPPEALFEDPNLNSVSEYLYTRIQHGAA